MLLVDQANEGIRRFSGEHLASECDVFVDDEFEELTQQKKAAKRQAILPLWRQPFHPLDVAEVVEVDAPLRNLVLAILDELNDEVQEERLEEHQQIAHEIASHQIKQIPFVAGKYGKNQRVLRDASSTLPLPDAAQPLYLMIGLVAVSHFPVVLQFELLVLRSKRH